MNSRYSRQELFKGIGIEGQQLLREKHVLIVGVGALGSGIAETLTRAGVGKLTLVDRDYVDWSNLQRQQLYTEEDVRTGLPKVIAAKQRLNSINSDVEIEVHVMDATTNNLEILTKDVDVMMDATDNFDIRFIINDLSQKYRVPWIYGACVGSYGLSLTILPGETPCLSCLLEKVPLGLTTCDTTGVIAPAVGMVVAYQTTEALKILMGNKLSLRRELVSFDLWENEHSRISVERFKNKSCLSCGSERVYPYLQTENETKSAVLCGRDTVQLRLPLQEMKIEMYKEIFEHFEAFICNSYLLAFSVGKHRMVVFKDGRVLIHGTKDIVKAKILFNRYFG